TRRAITLQRVTGESVTRRPMPISGEREAIEKGGFAHFMLKEIFEQPKAVSDTLLGHVDSGSGRIDLAEIGLDAAALAATSRVAFIACGTSLHAGLVGRHLVEELARVPADVEIASEFRHRQPVLDQHALAIPISQSGETADTLAALRIVRRSDARTIGICNRV